MEVAGKIHAFIDPPVKLMTKHKTAVVDVTCDSLLLFRFSELKEMGRVVFRHGDETVAVGIVLELLEIAKELDG